MRTGWIVAVQVSILCSGAFASESGLDLKAAKDFKVRWSSVLYNKSVSVDNPDVSTNSGYRSETLTLRCQAEVLDPSLVLATAQNMSITQITDSKGRDLTFTLPASNSPDMFRPLRYGHQFRQPAPIAKWRALLNKILLVPPQAPSPPQLVFVLQPCEITSRLDFGMLGQAGGELRTVKGYFHALVAGSIETVDVPFEPNNVWVRLTPDVEIQVQEAVSANNFYRFRIDSRPKGGPGANAPSMVGRGVPARFVTDQKFIGDDGKPLDRFSGGGGMAGGSVGGVGSGTGNVGHIKAIRFFIAVNARECKVPFEVQHVLLPKP